MLSWLHKFVSPKVDGIDSTLIKPSNWNDTHEVTTDQDGVILGRPAGAGPGEIQDMLIGDVQNLLIPAGVYWPYGGATAPAGFYLCYGQLLNRVTDARLFTAIGTTYGAGDGSTTFAAPDFRGVTLVGKSDMGGADRGNLPGGAVLGAYLGSPAQTAFVSMGVSGGISGSASGSLHGGAQGFDGSFVAAAASGSGAAPQNHTHNDVTVSGTLGVSGSFSGSGSATSGAFSIVQPSSVANFIIKR